MQFQCSLRTDIIVPDTGKTLTPLRVDLIQGTEYAILPAGGDGTTTTVWYQGDVYDFASSPSGSRDTEGTSNFARSIALRPGAYKVLVRAMYEIRMFGDPGLGKTPVIDMRFRVNVDELEDHIGVVSGLRVVPDVLDGWVMGEWMSVPIRLSASWGGKGGAAITSARGEVGGTDIRIEMSEGRVCIRAGQTRPIAFRVVQERPVTVGRAVIRLRIDVELAGQTHQLSWEYPLRQRRLSDREPFLITVGSPCEADLPALVTNATVVPPPRALTSSDGHPPVLLGLHGAGVDVESPFWAKALPDVPGMWAVLPSGKNEWGEDWHGDSATDALSARMTLSKLAPERLGERVSDRTL